jgi:membrane protease YdiL (CAAX protease family)
MTDIPIVEQQPALPRRSVVYAGVIGVLFLLYLLAATGGIPLLRLLGLTKSVAVFLFSNRTLFWVCLLLTAWYAARVEKQPLLLWAERRQGVGHYVAALVLLPIVVTLGLFLINPLVLLVTHKPEHSQELERMVRYCRAHPVMLFYTAVTAGVTEELLFRGYLLPRLELLFGRRWLAIIISSLLFGLGHYRYGTIVNVTGPIVIGLVQALYYDRYRNIKVIILFHILWDIAMFYLAFKHR